MTAVVHKPLPAADPALPDMPDGELHLIEQARHDPSALSTLYRLHCRPVWTFLWHMTADRAAADDLLMDVFVDFIRALPKFKAGSVRGWLYRVAARRAGRWQRRKRWRVLAPAEREPSAPATPEPEERETVRHALRGVPERLRTVLVLHYISGLGVEELARALGLRAGTVKSRLSRGREALRRRLPKEDRP